MRKAFLVALLCLASTALFAQGGGYSGYSPIIHVPGVGATLTVAASNANFRANADYVCDGTADDVQLNAAITRLSSVGGCIQLTEGTFYITAPVNLKSYVHISGMGPGTILKIPNGTSAISMLKLYTLSATQVQITDMTLDGNGKADIIPIELGLLCSFVRVERCHIKNAIGTSYGILANICSDVSIADCYFADFGDSCIETRETPRLQITGCNFKNGSLQIYAKDANGIGGTGPVVVSGNSFTDCNVVMTNDGATAYGYAFTGNVWKSAIKTRGFTWRVTQNLVMSGNVIDSSAVTDANGPIISIESTCSKYIISHNVIKTGYNTGTGVGYGAIYTAGPSGTISKNMITTPGTSSFGVKTTTGADGVHIADNDIVGTGAATSVAILLESVTGAVVSGNSITSFVTGISIAATCTGTSVQGAHTFASVGTSVSNLGASSVLNLPPPYVQTFTTLDFEGNTNTYPELVRSTFYVKAQLGGGAAGGGFIGAKFTDPAGTFSLGTNGLNLGSARKVEWNSGAGESDSGDTALERAGVNTVKVTDGASGAGDYQAPKGSLTAATATYTSNALVRAVTHKFTVSNAMVVALGANPTGDITVCTLPAKTVVRNVYVDVDTADTSANALTVACGRTGADYIDYIVASDAKSQVMYGDAAVERGTNLTGYDLPSHTGTTDVKLHFIKTATNLDTVTGLQIFVYIETTTLP